MSKLVTIYGGSGFLGRYISQQMAHHGWRVRAAVRRPNEAMFLKPYGAVGQVEPVLCNIRSDRSVSQAMQGADAVINCVGILAEHGPNTFDAIHREGAARVARLAAGSGVGHLVHVSAIGASAEAASRYSVSKAQGEAAVTEAFPGAHILRPSVMFGPEDQFFNKFASMARISPVIPLVGAHTRFQPVYVNDVATAAAHCTVGLADPGTYELGGPDIATLHELIDQMLDVIQRRRLVVNLPFWMGSVMGGILDAVQGVSLGLVRNTVLTRDQVRSLRVDNVVSENAKGLADLGITPVAMHAVLPEYLWPYRPSGQYATIRNSARNLRL